MDLSKYVLEEKPVDFYLEVDGEKLDCVFQVIGTHTDSYAIKELEMNREFLGQFDRGENIDFTKLTNEQVLEMRKNSDKRLAACIMGWSNVEFEGKPLEYSEDNALMLVSKVELLKEQLSEFLLKRENFTKA